MSTTVGHQHHSSITNHPRGITGEARLAPSRYGTPSPCDAKRQTQPCASVFWSKSRRD